MVTVSDLNLTMRQLTMNIEKCRLENLSQHSPNKSLEAYKQAYIYFQRYKPANWTLRSNSLSFGLEISKHKYLTEQQRFKVKYVGILERVDVATYAPRLIIANKDTEFAVWGDGVKKIMK